MDLSIVVPVYNEIDFIDDLIASLLISEDINKELVIVDGNSTDGTTERLDELKSEIDNLIVIKNPKRYVSHGFNLAFPKLNGDFIAFVGAHADYSPSYFREGLGILRSDYADAVGGVLSQKGKSERGSVIANCMSSKFGVGNTPFRTEKKERFVESVAFAIYKREIFEKIGLLDEELIRNQDDEFHYRLNAAGFKMLMTPKMSASYFVRDNIRSLFSQYYQYGLYKPLVFKKVPTGIKLRHLIPLFFALYILILPLAIFFKILFLPLILYVILITSIAVQNSSSVFQFFYSFLVFPTLHFSYGIGFLFGMFKL